MLLYLYKLSTHSFNVMTVNNKKKEVTTYLDICSEENFFPKWSNICLLKTTAFYLIFIVEIISVILKAIIPSE